MYLYGLGKCAEDAFKNIKRVHQEKYIEGVIDTNKKGRWNCYNIVDLEQIDRSSTIIITVKLPKYIKQIEKLLRDKGFKNIYYFSYHKTKLDFITDSCVRIGNWGEFVIPQVEMHISDYCNLNCKGCTHYSALFERKLPIYDEQIKDVIKLKSKCSHIIRFYILGGEPFLNTDIEKYLIGIKKELPTTDLWIVTNGLLLLSIPENILKKISELGIIVSISEYKPTHDIIDKIKKRLEKYDVSYDIREYEKKTKFLIPLSLTCNSKYENVCISDGCVNIWNGEIAKCPSLMYIDKLNDYFGVEFPNQGIMDLENSPNGIELIKKLEEKVPLCKHCVDKKIEWQQCDMRNIQLEDFVTRI